MRLVPIITAITPLALSISVGATPSESTPIEILTNRGVWVRGMADDQGILRGAGGVDLTASALAWIPIVNESVVARPPFSVLRVNDGQVIVGSFGGFHEGVSGSVIRWKHPGLALVDLPVDKAAIIQLQPMETAPRAVDADEIVMRNGDRVKGFVESFADPMTIESLGVRRDISVDRIAGIALVSTAPAGGAVRVWLAEGSVIDGTSLYGGPSGSFVLSGLTIALGRPTIALLADEVLCVAQFPKRIMPLSSLKPRVIPPTREALPRAEYPAPKIVRDDAPLGASTIEIRGPEGLVYEIPQGFSVLNAQVEIPAALRVWADCELIVRQNGRELARHPLCAATPRAHLMAVIQEGPLEIEIEEAGGGPISDTVILRRAILIAADGQG